MPETNSLLAAVRWIEGLLLGSVAVAIATIAFAGLGFLMLSGRIDMRTGARVVLGCFVLFGARTIASGLRTPVPAPELRPMPPRPRLRRSRPNRGPARRSTTIPLPALRCR
jgi:hypothetical protein